MTFGASHYVPVLKAKRGEKGALAALAGEIADYVTPLLEIVARKPEKPIDGHINTVFSKLASSVQAFERCFLDAREIEADGEAAAREVFARASADGIAFTPVTGVTRIADVSPAFANRTHGVAVRLTRGEFEAGGLSARLTDFLQRHQIEPEEVDLLLDLGAVEDLVVEGIAALTDAFLGAVPKHDSWRTFTISGCAFPLSMARVGRHSHEIVDRSEWIHWEGLYNRRHRLSRLPAFSDCGIQHPRGVEGFDPKTMQVSAAVRYACRDCWLLLKGESTKRTRSSAQFPVLAQKLVYGDLRARYCGAEHCAGCGAIQAAADGMPRLGSAEVWRRLGTIHHITTVVEQIRSLPWP